MKTHITKRRSSVDGNNIATLFRMVFGAPPPLPQGNVAFGGGGRPAGGLEAAVRHRCQQKCTCQFVATLFPTIVLRGGCQTHEKHTHEKKYTHLHMHLDRRAHVFGKFGKLSQPITVRPSGSDGPELARRRNPLQVTATTESCNLGDDRLGSCDPPGGRRVHFHLPLKRKKQTCFEISKQLLRHPTEVADLGCPFLQPACETS